jgi:hypothetical protein
LRLQTILYHVGLIPVVGGLVRAITDTEGNSRIEKRLRCLEYRLSTYDIHNTGLNDGDALPRDLLFEPTGSQSERQTAIDNPECGVSDNADRFDGLCDVAVTHFFSDTVSGLRTLPPPRNWK